MVLGSGIRDPGSGKNLFRIPDPGVKKAPDPGSGSATLGTGTGILFLFNLFSKYLFVFPRSLRVRLGEGQEEGLLVLLR